MPLQRDANFHMPIKKYGGLVHTDGMKYKYSASLLFSGRKLKMFTVCHHILFLEFILTSALCGNTHIQVKKTAVLVVVVVVMVVVVVKQIEPNY